VLTPTATTLSSSANPSGYGQKVTFTAVVTSGAGARRMESRIVCGGLDDTGFEEVEREVRLASTTSALPWVLT